MSGRGVLSTVDGVEMDAVPEFEVEDFSIPQPSTDVSVLKKRKISCPSTDVSPFSEDFDPFQHYLRTDGGATSPKEGYTKKRSRAKPVGRRMNLRWGCVSECLTENAYSQG